MAQKILITGASGGFGRRTANTLLKKGHNVAAAMRDAEGRNRSVAEELRSAGAAIVELDVTDDASVDRGVEAAIESAGGLDAVVNNAGVGVIGMQEAFTVKDWQAVFDINVFGVQRVNRAVLPHMRERGSGLIVFVSSLLGRMTLPFFGPYNASKWALEAMAENCRTELSNFGVDCCIVEPGGYPTAFQRNLLKPGDPNRETAYGEFADAPAHMFDGFMQALAAKPGQNPQNVADAIADLIETPAGERRFRTPVDKMGMGDPIESYNEHLDRVTAGIYEAFGLEDLLKLKS